MPDEQLDPWTRCMRRGDYEAAWRVSDAALRERSGVPCWHLPRHLQYIWDGTPLTGRRVLIRCYHGLGDTIQFIRYAPLVCSVAREVMVWAQPALLPLLASARGIHRLAPLHDGAPDMAYDVDVEIMELAHVFRTTLATILRRVPYLGVASPPAPGGGAAGRDARLRPSPAPCERDGRLAVGVAWQGGNWDERRSIPFTELAALAAVPGVRLHSLQQSPGPAAFHPAFEATPETRTISGTARLMRSLDLVITVDSMPAHLAGALGVPVWTLLPQEADWRWMEGRTDSPWYPTMRLFRQEAPGEWASVVARVAAALERRRDELRRRELHRRRLHRGELHRDDRADARAQVSAATLAAADAPAAP